MAIHLDVELDLNRRTIDRQADRLARDLENDFQRVGREVGNHFAAGFEQASPRIDKAAAKASKAVDNLAYRESVLNSNRDKAKGIAAQIAKLEGDIADARRDGTADTDALAKMEDQLTRRRITHANATKQAAKAQLEYAEAARTAALATRALQQIRVDPGNVQQVANFGALVGNLGKAAGPIGGAALVSGIVQLGGVAAQASGSLALIPAALTGVIAGFGTAKIATLGFSDALQHMGDPEKFAESLNRLSPSAAQAAKSIKGLVDGPMRNLRLSTQEAFFDGIGPQLEQLSAQFAPALQQMTTGVAGSLNSMMSGVMTQLATPETAGAIEQTMTNISTAFQNLAPAAAPLTQAFAELTVVGSDFLPEIASAATEAAQSFSAFISEASKSGELESFIRGGLDALKEIGPILGSVKDMFFALAPIGADVLPGIRSAFEGIATVLPPIVDLVVDVKSAIEIAQDVAGMFFGDFESGSQVFADMSNLAVRAFEKIRGAMDTALTPIRKLIDLYNALPFGDLPNIPSLSPTGTSDMPVPNALGGGANASRDRRGLAPVPTRGTTASPDFGPGAGSSALSGITGFHTSGWEDYRLPITGPSSSSGGSSGSGSKLPDGRVPNLANLEAAVERIFGVEANADVGRRDSFGEHASGEALDIMVGNNRALGDQINRWILENADAFGLQYNLWEQASWKPDGSYRPMEDRGSPTQNHMDHVHARVRAGEAADGNFMPPGMYESSWDGRGTQRVSVESFGSSASATLQQQIGSPLDQDFGMSKGIPGLIENAFKAIANLTFAPVLGALSGVTAAYGTAGSGTGLLGMTQPRQNAFGQDMPNIYGQYSQHGQTASSGYTTAGYSSPGGSPGLGLFGSPGPNGAPLGTPASGVGAGPLPGPGLTPGANPLDLSTGVAQTDERGIPHGQGIPASEGFGIGGGVIGMAQSAGGAAGALAGPGGAAMSAGAQIGIDLMNRAIGAGGQLAGNAVSGLMETFLPVESELADPSRGWFGRILGAVAGVRPAGQNTAGKLPQKDPNADATKAAMLKGRQEVLNKRDGQSNNSVTNNIQVIERENRNDYSVAKDIGYHSAKAMGGR